MKLLKESRVYLPELEITLNYYQPAQLWRKRPGLTGTVLHCFLPNGLFAFSSSDRRLEGWVLTIETASSAKPTPVESDMRLFEGSAITLLHTFQLLASMYYNEPTVESFALSTLVAARQDLHAGSAASVPLLEALAIFEAVDDWKRFKSTADGAWEAAPLGIGMPSGKLRHLIREMYGCTPVALHRTLLMEKALRLLGESKTSVASIALTCGYRNAENFIAAFRKKYGITPGQFRRNAHQRNHSS